MGVPSPRVRVGVTLAIAFDSRSNGPSLYRLRYRILSHITLSSNTRTARVHDYPLDPELEHEMFTNTTTPYVRAGMGLDEHPMVTAQCMGSPRTTGSRALINLHYTTISGTSSPHQARRLKHRTSPSHHARKDTVSGTEMTISTTTMWKINKWFNESNQFSQADTQTRYR